jgi:hypothetical protein
MKTLDGTLYRRALDCSGPQSAHTPCVPIDTWHRAPLRGPHRSGAPCKSTPVTGRRRCRMHGGADGSGAPQGARNGNYKHGRYTKEVAATRQWLREATHMLRDLNKRPG